jgi:hypothetical protein
MDDAIKIAAAAVFYRGMTITIQPPKTQKQIIDRLYDVFGDEDVYTARFGYLTTAGTFVEVSTAREVARAAGQIGDKPNMFGALRCDDLW